MRLNATPQEQLMWQRLRKSQLGGHKFTRQHVIGRYIVDFCCRAKRLVVEINGGQHDRDSEFDADRTRQLEDLGFRVLRFWNNEATENLGGGLLRIDRALSEAPDPHPNPLPTRERD